MAKANKATFKELVLTTTHIYKYVDKTGKECEYPFTIRQLTVGDIADITAEDNDDGEYLMIARSLDSTLDDVYEIPIAAIKGLVEAIVEFNDIGELDVQTTE